MTIALGIGAAIGSLLVSLMSDLVAPRRIFLVLPLLVGLTLAHLLWLTGRERPLDETESGAEEGIVESLGALPALARRYPIVLLMAFAVLINVIGQCIMEFEAFSIYTISYPDEGELASFLGKMTAIVDIVGILIVFFVSNPLIPRLGVARMNLVPPLLNLATFLGLAVSSRLPVGILAHLNYYPLEHSLNVPVFSLTYNAVPHRYVGRVRVINDGIVYPLALAASGVLLLAIEHVLPLSQVAMIGAAGALLYLLAQWGIGQQYLRGLVQMLRSGAIDLDQVGEGFKLPDDYGQDILAMLHGDDHELVALGIDLASRSGFALGQADLERALPMVPAKIARAALAVMAERHLRPLLQSSIPLLRMLALETMLVERHEIVARTALTTFLDDPDEGVRAVAAAGLVRYEATAKAQGILAHLHSEDAALAALNVLRCSAALPSVLEGLGCHASATVRAQALSVATMHGVMGEGPALAWGKRALQDADVAVRAGAITLLVRLAEPEQLGPLSHRAFADSKAEVRRSTALALGQRGGPALAILTGQLRGGNQDAIDEAMDGLGMSGPEIADGLIFAFLSETVFPTVARNIAFAKRLPSGRQAWTALDIAIADANSRAVHSVLHALGVLGYNRVLGLVRMAMKAAESRTRANAVETLSSLAHRRYILPLLPLLEAQAEDHAEPIEGAALDAETLLTELTSQPDPFIRAAAMTVWAAEFGAAPAMAGSDTSSLVTATLHSLARTGAPRRFDEEPPMNRLAFLKSVPLFAEMSLDHLMAVDAAMTREPYLPGERVVAEGDLGDKLYIVFKGEVAIRKRVSASEERELARLTSGQLFGEMALFDDERRSASVVALTDAELLAIDREQFHSLAYQRPEIPMQICKVLVARLRTAIS